jgi:hypothetical protein
MTYNTPGARGAILRDNLGLVTDEELAAALMITPDTLALWRGKKQGPAWCRLGKRVFYRLDDVTAWIRDQADGPGEVTSEGN